MDFLNPPMLAGLAAALVPLVIHLLNHSRYRNVDWGAMMFLQSFQPRADHAARLKQWSLLILRAAAVGLLAFGMARPVFRTVSSAPRRPGRTAAVILLDRSSSMSLNDNGRPRLDLARDAVYQLLSPGFSRGDDLWLVTLGDGDVPPIYASDPQEMARRVREVSNPSGVADVAAGLDKAVHLLERSTAPNREIYVVTDHQASTWSKVDASFARAWRKKTEVAGRPHLTLIPIGTDEKGNVAVKSIRPVAEPLISGRPTDFEVAVENFGAVPRSSVMLTVSVTAPGGRTTVIRRDPLNLPAQGSVSRAISVAFGDPGCYVATASVDAPGVVTDKAFSRSLDVIAPMKVLVVDGDARESGSQSASSYLNAALSPYHDPSRDSFAIDVIHPDAWTEPELSRYRVVMLANVPGVNDAQARALEQFAFDGGGVVVLPGDQTRVEQLDVQLPWLPASLSPASPEGETSATGLGAIGPELGGTRQEMRESVVVRRYFPATPRNGAAVLARFDDGKPFVIAGNVGHGRAMMVTSPVDTDWNALPLTPIFLPLAQSVVSYAAAGSTRWREGRWNVTTGEPLVARFNTAVDPRKVRVDGPARSASPVICQLPGATEILCRGVVRSGVYRVSTKGGENDPSAVRFSVRTPAAESDLTPLSQRDRDRIGDSLGATWADPDAGPLWEVQEARRSGWSLWLPAIGAVISLCVIELAAMRRWAGGAA